MQVLNLDEKNTERMDAINKFTLMDDTFMTQVFSSDLECTEELLKIILKRDDLTVTKSVTQLTIGNLFGRSVRLDIYANDSEGKQYDIEVQQDEMCIRDRGLSKQTCPCTVEIVATMAIVAMHPIIRFFDFACIYLSPFI